MLNAMESKQIQKMNFGISITIGNPKELKREKKKKENLKSTYKSFKMPTMKELQEMIINT